MENYKSDFDRYEEAKKRVDKIKGFYYHLLSYVCVMIFLIFINLYFTPEYLWFFWTLIGWGIGVLLHALGVFNLIPFFGKDWEQKKIDEIIKKENQTKWK